MNKFLTFAHQLADAAGAAIRPYFGAHGAVEAKGDDSPVTIADREAEAAMRALIEREYPTHAIYGEEFGTSGAADSGGKPSPSLGGRFGWGSAEGDTEAGASDKRPSPNPLPKEGEGFTASRAQPHYTWVLDPIDGTRAFIAGRHEWGTLIALCENGVPVLGILDQPMTGERWVGVKGQQTMYYTRHAPHPTRPTYADNDHASSGAPTSPQGEVTPLRACAPNSPRGIPLLGERSKNADSDAESDAPMEARFSGEGQAIRTRPCPSLAQASISTTSRRYFTAPQAVQFAKVAEQCREVIEDGDCYAYGLLARGERDIVVDAGLKPYDILALVPIIEGAGGRITTWDGAAVTMTNYRDVVAVGDRQLDVGIQ